MKEKTEFFLKRWRIFYRNKEVASLQPIQLSYHQWAKLVLWIKLRKVHYNHSLHQVGREVWIEVLEKENLLKLHMRINKFWKDYKRKKLVTMSPNGKEKKKVVRKCWETSVNSPWLRNKTVLLDMDKLTSLLRKRKHLKVLVAKHSIKRLRDIHQVETHLRCDQTHFSEIKS